MKKTISKFVLLLISSCFFISTSLRVEAQCDTPIEASENCDFIFMLDGNALEDGFCASLPESNPISELTPFCFDISSSENTGFFLFEPTGPILTFKIIPMNCTEVSIPGQGVFIGMQAAIFEDCTFTEFRACAPTCHPDEFIIGANDFQPLKTYVLALDGCQGSICDFTIEVVTGGITALVPLDNPVLNSPEEVCQYDLSQIQVDGLPLLTDGAWSVDGGVNFEIRFNGKAIQVNDWGAPGVKTICATITDPNNTAMYYDSCWQVTVKTTPSIISMNESDSLCLDDEIDLDFEATEYDSFSWTWEGGSCNNCPNPVFTMADEEIEVTLELSFGGECAVESTVVYYPEDPTSCIVNIENVIPAQVQIIPNPFQSAFDVKMAAEFNLKLYDSQGKLMIVENGVDKMRIDGSSWSQGVFFLVLTDDSGNTSFQKLIKQ